MKWITRQFVHVDRVACPWLIRKFVDPEAEFFFVPAQEVESRAKELDAIPFDVPGAELGHHEDRCSFDAIIAKYNLHDEALQDLAIIVRAADTDLLHSSSKEAFGLEAIADGSTMIAKDDEEAINKGAYIYDSLYAHCQLHRLRVEHATELEGMNKVLRRQFLRGKLLEP